MSVKIHEEIGGYNMNLFVGKTENELNEVKCGVCFDVYRDPKQCTNGHMHCASCTQNFLHPKCCPNCRVITQTLSDNLFVKNLISKMSVQCVSALNENQYEERKCNWHGQLCDLQRHVHEECQLTVVDCSFENCQAEMVRADLAEHEAECPYRLVKCKHCHSVVIFFVQNEHEVECEWRPVKCNQDCGMTMPANQHQSHIEKDCPNTEVGCSMFKLVRSCKGCDGTVLRRDSESHLTEDGNLAGNFIFLLKHCGNLMTEMTTKLDESREATNKNHAQLTNQMQSTQIKLYVNILKRNKDMFDTTGELRWEHDAVLCETLAKWVPVFHKANHVSAMALLNKQLGGEPVERDGKVLNVALELQRNEKSDGGSEWLGKVVVTILPGVVLTVHFEKRSEDDDYYDCLLHYEDDLNDTTDQYYAVLFETSPPIKFASVSISLLGPNHVRKASVFV